MHHRFHPFYSFILSFIHLIIHSIDQAINQSFIHSFIHLFIYCLNLHLNSFKGIKLNDTNPSQMYKIRNPVFDLQVVQRQLIPSQGLISFLKAAQDSVFSTSSCRVLRSIALACVSCDLWFCLVVFQRYDGFTVGAFYRLIQGADVFPVVKKFCFHKNDKG